MLPLSNITKNSFTATWKNVPVQVMQNDSVAWNPVFFKLITTREITAKKDGAYTIAGTKISGNPDNITTVISAQQALMDKQFSQPAWIGSSVYWTPDGIAIKGAHYDGYPADVLGAIVRLTSPVMDLSNSDGKYSVKFTAKVIGGKNKASINVFGAGDELDYYRMGGVPGVKTISIPNDGKEHTFELQLEYGTWCHRIIIENSTATDVEFLKEIVIKQDLKEGDKAYRSTFWQQFPYEAAKPLSKVKNSSIEYDNYDVEYTRNFIDVDSRCLDKEAAEKDGERVGCRLLVVSQQKLSKSIQIDKSMYSEPTYLDRKTDDNKYLYLGYVGYENPTYQILHPGGPTWDGYHGGAIKLTKELLKNNIGDKVVGIRFVTAACGQKNQVNSAPGYYDIKNPFIFLANSLKIYTDKGAESVTDTIMTKSPGKFKDGWNSVFFDKPYVIKKDSEFFAGIYAYDETMSGGIVVGSLHHTTNDPNAVYIGTNWSSYRFDEARFTNYLSSWNSPLLIQVIVEPSNPTENILYSGELRDIKLPDVIYSDVPLKFTADIYNSGIKTITEANIVVELNGKKIEKEIKLPVDIVATESHKFIIDNLDVTSISGVVPLKLTLKKVNGKIVSPESSINMNIEVINKNDVFERVALVENFTCEACMFCPEADVEFDQLLAKPENKEIVKHMAVVNHHAFFSPDFLAMQYSKDLVPFFGIENKSGDIKFSKGSSPATMINRMPNPKLGYTDKKGCVSNAIRGVQSRLEESIEYATITNPTFIKSNLKPYFNKANNSLKIDIEGVASKRYDRKRPIFVSILITQDKVLPRQQKNAREGFIHSNVLRIVDDGGFKGTQLDFDENGFFKFSKEILIKGVNNNEPKIPDNTIILNDDETLEDAMKNVNVMALLHYYEPLPTLDDVVENDDRIFKNEVLNVSQRRVSFTSFESAEKIADSDNITVYTENGSIHINGEVSDVKVYSMKGVLMPTTGLIPGTYIVYLTLLDGNHKIYKVVIE